ncbi:nucleotidyltransferase family protein [Tenacibaculum sp.]|nr:nucleotidyltransferase family protein [Tenacibaculum sp.]
MKTAILILAAGTSSRMKTNKQLLPYKNTSLLGWAIKNAQKSEANDVFCVLGNNAAVISKKISAHQVKTIYNPNYKTGLSSSIVSGINFLKNKEFDHLLIMLADQPLIDTEHLDEILRLSQKNPLKIIASKYQKNIGTPALFPKFYFNELLKLQGDKGAKLVLQNHISKIVYHNNYKNLIDIDTPNEYQNLIKNKTML